MLAFLWVEAYIELRAALGIHRHPQLKCKPCCLTLLPHIVKGFWIPHLDNHFRNLLRLSLVRSARYASKQNIGAESYIYIITLLSCARLRFLSNLKQHLQHSLSCTVTLLHDSGMHVKTVARDSVLRFMTIIGYDSHYNTVYFVWEWIPYRHTTSGKPNGHYSLVWHSSLAVGTGRMLCCTLHDFIVATHYSLFIIILINCITLVC